MDKIQIPEVAQRAEVDENDAADVLMALCQMGWLKSDYVVWNMRTEGNLELPDND